MLLQIKPTAEVALSDSSYFPKRGENSKIYLSRLHKYMYYYQVQGQIALCNSMYCDFATCTWTPRRTFIECIDRDNPFIANVLPQITSLFAKYMYLLPELLTHALEPDSQAIDDNEKLYCITVSRRPDSGQMIACENAHCPTAWFHFDCVGLKCAPCVKWFCVDCKKYTKNLIIIFVLTYKQW